MKQKLLNYYKKDRFVSVGLTVLFSVLLTAVAIHAATTIGSNITTGGTLSVTGASSLATASTTGDFWLGNVDAEDDDYLYMDASSTEYLAWDDDPGEFDFSDDVHITGNATTTGYFVIGATSPLNNMAAGDALFGGSATVTGDLVISGGDLNKDGTALTIGGNLTVGAVASATDYFVIGNSLGNDDDALYFDIGLGESLAWDDDPGEFDFSDDVHITDNATTTGYFVIGATSPLNNMAAGDALFGGSATVTGDLVISGGDLNKDGTALTIGGNLTVGAVASATDYFVIGNSLGNDDDALYFDIGLGESLAWDDDPGEFDFSDDVHITGNATTTGYFVIGATSPLNNMAAGDALFGGSATVTGDLVISGGDLNKNGTALAIGGNATSSGFLIVGTTNPSNDMAAGDLLLGGSATVTGDLVISGGDLNKNGTALAIGGNATSSGFLVVGTTNPLNNMSAGDLLIGNMATVTEDFVVGSETETSTSTLSIKAAGGDGANGASCIEMVDVLGTLKRIYIAEAANSLTIESGPCKL